MEGGSKGFSGPRWPSTITLKSEVNYPLQPFKIFKWSPTEGSGCLSDSLPSRVILLLWAARAMCLRPANAPA